MPEDIVKELLINLKNSVDAIFENPPDYRKSTFPDGTEYYAYSKPTFKLASLGYNYKEHTKEENTKILKEVLWVINKYYNDAEICIYCEPPVGEPKLIMNVFDEIRDELTENFGHIYDDYIFTVSLP